MPNHPDVDPHDKLEMQERWDAEDRRHRVFGIGGAILALAIIGLGVLVWRAYPQLRQQAAALATLPGIQQIVNQTSDHLKEVDLKIAEWASDRDALNDRLTKLGQRVETRFETMRKQVNEASAETMRRVQAQIDSQAQAVETRLGRLESGRDKDQTQIADLQRELNQVRDQLRTEMEKQTGELNALRRDVEDRGAAHERQVADLREREERDQREVASVQQKLAVRRVDFEVTKNRSTELTDGISLDVTGTDVNYRRVNGWMWVLGDARTIWLKNQTAQEPVIFYGYKDGKKRELVITNVTKNWVTGYLLLPADESATARTSPADGGE